MDKMVIFHIVMLVYQRVNIQKAMRDDHGFMARPHRTSARRAAEALTAPASEMLLQAAFTASSDWWRPKPAGKSWGMSWFNWKKPGDWTWWKTLKKYGRLIFFNRILSMLIIGMFSSLRQRGWGSHVHYESVHGTRTCSGNCADANGCEYSNPKTGFDPVPFGVVWGFGWRLFDRDDWWGKTATIGNIVGLVPDMGGFLSNQNGNVVGICGIYCVYGFMWNNKYDYIYIGKLYQFTYLK